MPPFVSSSPSLQFAYQLSDGAEQAQAAQDYLQGLRAVVEFLTAHPHLITASSAQDFYFCATGTEFAHKARMLLDGAGAGDVVKSYDNYANVTRMFGPHKVQLYTDRDEVCDRVQVGTQKVAKQDPAALKALPLIEIEEPVYEWKCRPILEGIA